MCIEKTNSIKGIFILLVFLRHICSYADYNGPMDQAAVWIDRMSRQLIVAMFLFYSGYGIMEAIRRKGYDYVKAMPVKRIGSVWADFAAAVSVFWILRTLMGKKYGFSKIVLSYLGWDGLGNSNWYLFSILVMYLLTYVSFRILRKNHWHAVIGVTILSTGYILVMMQFKEGYWYNTVLCYTAGMWFSLLKTRIDRRLETSGAAYLSGLLVTSGIMLAAWQFAENQWVCEAGAVAFSFFVVLLTMKFGVKNKILCWLGQNLFPLYIYQRIPMILLRRAGLAEWNGYAYFAACFVCMFGIVPIYQCWKRRGKSRMI
ncbi:MAG: acyltransferase family protein [Lachnospiraceae bacterium]|nr:acyltransferase family protein [Lachnospiraceae bacterium]